MCQVFVCECVCLYGGGIMRLRACVRARVRGGGGQSQDKHSLACVPPAGARARLWPPVGPNGPRQNGSLRPPCIKPCASTPSDQPSGPGFQFRAGSTRSQFQGAAPCRFGSIWIAEKHGPGPGSWIRSLSVTKCSHGPGVKPDSGLGG